MVREINKSFQKKNEWVNILLIPSLPLSFPFLLIFSSYIPSHTSFHVLLPTSLLPCYSPALPTLLNPTLSPCVLEVDGNECCDRLQQVISFLTLLTGDSPSRSLVPWINSWKRGREGWGRERISPSSSAFSFVWIIQSFKLSHLSLPVLFVPSPFFSLLLPNYLCCFTHSLLSSCLIHPCILSRFSFNHFGPLFIIIEYLSPSKVNPPPFS